MIELGLLSTKTSFDIAEAFAISELSKGQTEELIPAGEIFDVAIALVPIDANLKLVGGGSPRVERKRFGLDSSTASGANWKAVGWRQKRSKKLKAKKLTETPYPCSIKQLRWTAWTFLGQH
ncbi:MAG: hypothetical protein JWN63_2019 [Candidatus Acidoferrum typicum]|nr:hypothetical protein [Candidatus Acidoferrum typicum]